MAKRSISNANAPVDWNGACFDRPMWFAPALYEGYRGGHERTFGDDCEECGERMTPGDDGLHCESCGHYREYSK